MPSKYTVFKPAGRKFYMMQIRLPDGTRPPYRSTKTTKKAEALAQAQAWLVRARKEAEARTIPQGQAFLRLVLDAERLAADGLLTASKAEEIIRKIHALSDPDAKPVSLAQYWDGLIRRELPTAGPATIENMRFAKKRWTAALGDKMEIPLPKLTLDHLEKALPRMAEGLAPATANLYRGELLRVLSDATGRKVIDSNPGIRLKTASKLQGLKETTPKGVFTPDEIKTLLEAADDEWRGMILGGFYTALRMMDVAKLSSDDIEAGFILTTSAKTSTDTDTPIHPRLKEWIGNRQGPFFPNQRDATNATVSTRFSALMKKAGVPKLRTVRKRTFKRSFHSLRHTFASIVANEGIPQDVRMALTGSSDPKVASRYVHVSDEKLMEAIATIPNIEFEEGVA